MWRASATGGLTSPRSKRPVGTTTMGAPLRRAARADPCWSASAGQAPGQRAPVPLPPLTSATLARYNPQPPRWRVAHLTAAEYVRGASALVNRRGGEISERHGPVRAAPASQGRRPSIAVGSVRRRARPRRPPSCQHGSHTSSRTVGMKRRPSKPPAHDKGGAIIDPIRRPLSPVSIAGVRRRRRERRRF